MGIALHVVHNSPEHVSRAQRILESAPNYERLVSGTEVSPNAGEEFFSDLPPGKTCDDKSTFIVLSDHEEVGLIECIRGWRESGYAHIGLLLIGERHQGVGIGAAAMHELERWIAAAWPETHTLRIGVIENNSAAFAFWKKVGFVDTGERRDNGFIAPAAVMLKSLRASDR